jgi:ATP-dependent exoDNAse (exonuclease V) beta subunit
MNEINEKQLTMFDDFTPIPHGLVIYKASAGSGKTYTLTFEYLKQALATDNSHKFREILAVTFTNKATDQMKSRIIAALSTIIDAPESDLSSKLSNDLGVNAATLSERAAKVRQAILHDYSSFSISTIDKFFQRIIRAFVREAGLRPAFKLELDYDRLLDEAVDNLMLNIHKNATLYRLMSDIIDEQMEKGRNWDVRNSLRNKAQEVFKEQFRGFEQEFYDKIGDEKFMKNYSTAINEIVESFESRMSDVASKAINLIDSAGLNKNDFKYSGTGTVSYFDKLKNKVYEEPGKRIKDLLVNNDHRMLAKSDLADLHKLERITQITPELTKYFNQAITLIYSTEYSEYCTAMCIKQALSELRFFAEIERSIRKITGDENLIPISETTHLLRKLISDNDTPFILERVGTRYNAYMIDEFQDTSVVQWSNFKPLLKNSLASNNPVLVVGDVKQSIYRWRNSDWEILADRIQKEFKQFKPVEVTLDKNWRSFPAVVKFNNYLFDALPAFIRNEFENNSQATSEPVTLLEKAYRNVAQEVAERNRNAGGYVSILAVRDDDETKAREKILAALPALIADIQDRGYRAADIAILVRTAADGQQISEHLLNCQKDDPTHCYNILSDNALLVRESAAVQFVVAVMRAIINPDNKINNVAINRFLHRGDTAEFDWNKATVLAPEMRRTLLELTSLSLPEVFEQLNLRFRLGDNPDEVACLQEFHDFLVTFSNRDGAYLSTFLDYWDEKEETLKLSEGRLPDAIVITTVHKAKGLEYPVVLAPFCDWKMKPSFRDSVWTHPQSKPFNRLSHIPVSYGERMKNSAFIGEYYTETAKSLVDNLNLLYVAFTRAGEELHIGLPLPKQSRHELPETDKLRNAALTLYNFLESEAATSTEIIERYSEDDRQYYICGEKGRRAPSSETMPEGIVIDSYTSSPFEKKLRLKYESARYFTEQSPMQSRNYGKLMHRVFSMLHSVADVATVIKTIEEEGLIAREEIAELKNHVNRALHFINNYAPRWFAANSPYTVVTERFVLLPASMNDGMSRRPDRIMMSDKETIVLDYKFGSALSNEHKTQVRNYMQLLEAMNCQPVKGFIWYVNINYIDRVYK